MFQHDHRKQRQWIRGPREGNTEWTGQPVAETQSFEILQHVRRPLSRDVISHANDVLAVWGSLEVIHCDRASIFCNRYNTITIRCAQNIGYTDGAKHCYMIIKLSCIKVWITQSMREFEIMQHSIANSVALKWQYLRFAGNETLPWTCRQRVADQMHASTSKYQTSACHRLLIYYYKILTYVRHD